jgi:hypothetical protein
MGKDSPSQRSHSISKKAPSIRCDAIDLSITYMSLQLLHNSIFEHNCPSIFDILHAIFPLFYDRLSEDRGGLDQLRTLSFVLPYDNPVERIHFFSCSRQE